MRYEPELGQTVFGNPTGKYILPEFAEALLHGALEEIDRVVMNRDQEGWNSYKDPKMPNIEVRPYCWNEESEEAIKPNFKFENVEIRWYKHPRRGLSCNVEMEPNQWAEWYERLLSVIRSNEPTLF